jgi:cellulose synthase/poly-beta-1,6-N-acetylglucosamine synthase-like glycosyltransferase
MTIALTTPRRGKLKRKETRAIFHPRQVLDVELSEPLPSLGVNVRRPYSEALLLVRLHRYPIAQVMVSLEHPLGSEDLAADLWQSLAPSINTFLKRQGLAPASSLADPQLEALGLSMRAKREAFLNRAPVASVVICSRSHAENLARCLKSVSALEYPNYEIIVIDSAPKSEATKQVVERWKQAGAPLHYVLEPTPSLSAARNTALQHVKGKFVAYLEADEVADPYWLLELAQGFERDAKVALVAGVIVPAELEFQAQVWGEELASHGQECGFTPESFNLSNKNSLLTPVVGAGSNMAFKTATLRKIGFDTTLGAGTSALRGEERAAFVDVLMAGQTVVYQPSAIVRHYHPRDVVGLQMHLHGEGMGLAAFYLRCLRKYPRLAPQFALLFPRILPSVFGSKHVLGSKHVFGSKNKVTTTTVPRTLKTAKRRGFLQGFATYAKSLWLQKRSKG